LSKSFLLLFFKKAGLPAAGLTCGRLPGQLPFLQKRTKRLLIVLAPASEDTARPKSEKFLVLFFKKELPCLPLRIDHPAFRLILLPAHLIVFRGG
jgi:hypothetical protein